VRRGFHAPESRAGKKMPENGLCNAFSGTALGVVAEGEIEV
jgi:hypothetical protein